MNDEEFQELADEAIDYITHEVDSGPDTDTPLKPGETLNQCSNCGRRIITKMDEVPPRHCACDCDEPLPERQWIAVRQKDDDPDPWNEAVVDVAQRWPISADKAREFLYTTGYNPEGGSQ